MDRSSNAAPIAVLSPSTTRAGGAGGSSVAGKGGGVSGGAVLRISLWSIFSIAGVLLALVAVRQTMLGEALARDGDLPAAAWGGDAPSVRPSVTDEMMTTTTQPPTTTVTDMGGVDEVNKGRGGDDEQTGADKTPD